MPLARITYSEKVYIDEKEQFAKGVSEIVSDVLEKPEKYIMVTFEDNVYTILGGETPALLVEVMSIGGLNEGNTQSIVKRITELAAKTLSIDKERIYINFTDYPPHMWGWSGKTFG